MDISVLNKYIKNKKQTNSNNLLKNYIQRNSVNKLKSNANIASVVSNANSAISIKDDWNKDLDPIRNEERNAKENAYLTLEKLKSYLPLEMEREGVSGSNIGQTQLLNAYNNYISNLGNISQNYNKQYNTALSAKQNSLFNILVSAYNNGDYSSSDRLEKYYNNFRDLLTAEQNAELNRIIQEYRSDEEKAREAEEKKNNNWWNNFWSPKSNMIG